ncbi:MAG: insulinase family protein [Phycisphaerales bacterium]|nr:insulinase family protein [Phycisphaerales bacterium]
MKTIYRETTLANGLRIAAECAPDAASAAVGLFVGTGARDEPKELMGVSHFLEHMMFKGSATRLAREVNEAFDRIGARNNAFTSHEMTAYHAHVLPEHCSESLTLVADLLRPALREEDFQQERHVILEEIAMYEDNPFWVIYERALEVYFKDHPLGFRVLGTKESVGAMTRNQMHEYFTERYSPANTVLVAAGKIDFDALVAQAARETAEWKSTSVKRVYPTWSPNAGSFTIAITKATRGYMVLLWPAPSQTDSRRYAAMLCAQIIGDSEGSRLHWALVETGIAVHAAVGFHGRDGSGECVASIVCATEDLDKAEKIVRRECQQLSESLTEDDLVRARRKIATAVAVAGESPSGRMQRLGSVLTSIGVFSPLEAELEKINALTLEDLRTHLQEFPYEPVVVARAVPPSEQT